MNVTTVKERLLNSVVKHGKKKTCKGKSAMLCGDWFEKIKANASMVGGRAKP
jgi:hypothetical protein